MFKNFSMSDVLNKSTITRIDSSESILIYVLEKGFLDIKNGVYYFVSESKNNAYDLYKDNILLCTKYNYADIVQVVRSIINKVKLSR